MDGLEAMIATHVVRSHRTLRRGLSDLERLAGTVDGPVTQEATIHAARDAVDFLDRNMLAHADLEDLILDRYLDGSASRGSGPRLRSQHDTLREAVSHLHDYLDAPTDRISVAGMLLGVAAILRTHLDDEWDVLPRALATLDAATCALCEPVVAGTAARPSVRRHLPVAFEAVGPFLAHRQHGLRTCLAEAATRTIRRGASQPGQPGHDTPPVAVELVPAVQSPHVDLRVGRLHIDGGDTTIDPVEFEITMSPRQDGCTELEAYQATPSARSKSTESPATQVGQAAFRAVIEEFARIVGDRSAAGGSWGGDHLDGRSSPSPPAQGRRRDRVAPG